MLGVMTVDDALRRAEQEGLDLVEISPNSDPPVCKILDYGKYKYEAQKKLNAARKSQKVIEVKEVKLRPNIDEHDYKVTMRFRGREMAHQDLGMNVLNRVRDDVGEEAKVEAEPKLEGRQMIMILAPR
jgi:translation initiation factor IF-3